MCQIIPFNCAHYRKANATRINYAKCSSPQLNTAPEKITLKDVRKLVLKASELAKKAGEQGAMLGFLLEECIHYIDEAHITEAHITK